MTASGLPSPARRRQLLLLGLLPAWLAACASRPRSAASPAEAPPESFSGRLSLIVASEPPGQFHAAFDLTGNAQAGELSLASPLGNILAVLQWRPGEALLRQGEETRRYASIDALAAAVTGAAVPVRALFDWLHGNPQAEAGWEPDLSRLADGRLLARRMLPAPAAELRVVLDRP